MTRLLLLLLVGAVVSGCASLSYQTSGESGPVTWHAEDLRVVQRTVAGAKRDIYTFTLALRETQGTGITFTQLDTTVHQLDIAPVSSSLAGKWKLRPLGELRWPLSFYIYCMGFELCEEPNLFPSYEIVLTGTDTQGQPMRVTANLRLPPNPRAIPKTQRTNRTATQQISQASPASTVVAHVPIQIINNAIFVSALANRKERLMLLLDTGATHTMLTPDVAVALDLRVKPKTPRRKIQIFGGREINVPFVQLKELAIENAVVKDLEVGIYVVAPEAPVVDGLLGGDFLNHFTVTLDHAASRLRLASSKAAIGLEFVPIPAGQFRMGSTDHEAEIDEQPVHPVHISQPFYLGKYEVTQGQWQEVMGKSASYFKGDPNQPVENVSWNEVQTFIRKLNAKESGTRYRLPTEAEWEYAARAGSTTAYSFGDEPNQLAEYAWCRQLKHNKTYRVGQLKPNAWGLYDMHGNVWEWVQDTYDGTYYQRSPATDPPDPASSASRVTRGGSWSSDARTCRSASRLELSPDYRGHDLGFRLVREAP